MMVRRVAEKDHPVFIFIGELETHNLRPKLLTALDIADTQDHMADFFNFDGSLFVCHKTLLYLSPEFLKQTVKIIQKFTAVCLSRKRDRGKASRRERLAHLRDGFLVLVSFTRRTVFHHLIEIFR